MLALPDPAVSAIRRPAGVDLSVRIVHEQSRALSVLRGVVQPDSVSIDAGAMVTAWIGNGIGYSATADLSPEGLQSAADRAVHWARLV
ncbi:MAG: hypothetical protein KAY46_08405, partial [Burkholderiaceae bacterium]|nr:hypothetical protein [Burkholderiaceae bacterium]